MIILGIEFLALIVICYVFLVYATRNQVSESKEMLIPGGMVWVVILILLAMVLFTVWYIRLGLA